MLDSGLEPPAELGRSVADPGRDLTEAEEREDPGLFCAGCGGTIKFGDAGGDCDRSALNGSIVSVASGIAPGSIQGPSSAAGAANAFSTLLGLIGAWPAANVSIASPRFSGEGPGEGGGWVFPELAPHLPLTTCENHCRGMTLCGLDPSSRMPM